METDERLLPVPEVKDSHASKNLQTANHEYPPSYSPFYDEDSFNDKRSIREYFNVIYKRLPYILALTLLTTAAVAFYMYRQPSIYQANTTLIIEPRKPKPQNTQSVNINFGNDQNYYNTQLELLRKPDLMQDVVIRLGLHKNPNLMDNNRKGVFATISSIFSGEEKPPTINNELPVISTENPEEINRIETTNLTPQEKALAERYAASLLGGLSVEQRERTNLVTLSVINTNPSLAAKVSDAVATVFIEQDIKRETSGAEKAYRELTKSIEELKNTIAAKEQAFINEMRSSGLALGDGKVSELSAEELGTLGKQRLDAIDERRRIEAEYNAASRSNNPYGLSDGSGSQVASSLRERNEERKAKLDEQLREIDKQIKDLEVAKSELLVKYTPEYYKVKQVEAKIRDLTEFREKTERERTQKIESEKQKTEKEVQSDIVSALRAKLEAARKRESQLDAAYTNAINSANIKGVAETKLTTLKREIETYREQLDTYIKTQKEQELAIQSSRPDNINISANAVTPTAPIGPNRNRNIVIAFLVSLIGGIGLSFLLDYLDDSIKSSDDIGRHLGLPTLSLIPHHNLVEKKKRKMLSVGENGLASSTALIALEDNRSAMAEAYRHLRTSLLFSSAGKPPETILVTSSQPAEGKTTTAINTAITLAQSGADVVLVDCDLRRPRLHNHFNMENSHGLTNYLSGERDTDNLLRPVPRLPNLKVITSGPIPPNPAELLSSNEMKHLLQFLKGNFKHIVIDSPPAISFTDAAILSTLVDGVVLVAMAGKSSIHLMRRFKQRLANIGARVYGVVLNGIKPNSVDYGYYGYGYTYSYYNSNEEDSTPSMNGDSKNFSDENFFNEDEYIEVEEDELIHDTKD